MDMEAEFVTIGVEVTARRKARMNQMVMET